MIKIAAFSFLALTSSALGINIQIDYTFDQSGFFNVRQRRNAIEAVADFYGSILQDNLLRIDRTEFPTSSTWTARFSNPATGATEELRDLIIPEDTIIIYVGARNLGQSASGGTILGRGGPGGFGASGVSRWLDRIRGRGQSGALGDQGERTDVGLWGGSITFDVDTNWNFSLSRNRSGIEFVRTAAHEIMHVLGIGPSEAWDNLVVNNFFQGAAATASNGSPPSADGSHFISSLNSPTYGFFGIPHGVSRPVTMLPSSNDNGRTFNFITDLDLAGLVDIGWEVALPTQFTPITLGPDRVTFSWPTSSFLNYRVIRSNNLTRENGSSAPFSGDGSIQTWRDPAPLPNRAFYQLETTSSILPAASTFTSDSLPNLTSQKTSQTRTREKSEQIQSIEEPIQFATGCYCEH